MKLIILTFITVAISCSFTIHAQERMSSSFSNELLACWKVKDCLYNDSSYSLEQLKLVLKKIICFEKGTAVIFDDILVDPKYSIERLNSEKYLSYHCHNDKKYFDITADSLTVIQITGYLISKNSNGLNSPYDFFYDGKYLYLYQNKVAFRLYRLGNVIGKPSHS
jgi:hypothetical protein